MEHQSFSKIKVWLTLTLAVCSFSLFSQTGTVFWATAPYSTPSHDGNHTIHVVVSSLSSAASVTLSIPANTSFTPITINLPANSTDYFDFNSLMLPLVEESEWDQKTNKGILIESSDVITAYLEVFSIQNSDIFALKGKNGLGTDFYTPFETKWANHDFGCSGVGCVQAYNSINIVATENNTTVWITPSVDVYKNSTGVHAAGIPYSVTLNKGQTFTVRTNNITVSAQPAGTHITSNKPIAVTICDDSMEIGSNYDIVGDQLVPVNVEGSQYIAMKGYLADEYVFGVISENNTKISIDGTLRAKTYNKGDTINIKLVANTTVIQSDNKQKFNIFHVSGKADEAGGALLPPTDQCTGSLQVGFNFGHAETGNYLYLNLMCRVGAESNFLVDGATASWLTPATFTAVSGTSWSVARFTLTNVDLAKGNHIISNTKDYFHLGYINYTGPGSEYGYFSDFEKLDVAAVAIKSNTDTAVACTGEELQLRVDGGVNYSWTGKNTVTNADASMYLSSKTVYNPRVLGTIPMGLYTFTVNVTSACSGPTVSKTIKIEVVQSPADQTKIVDFCESEVGSGCVSNLNLTNYTNLLTGGWPTANITSWNKDGYNEWITLDNYDGTRVVKYGVNNAATFNMAATNPKINAKNGSATVLKYIIAQNNSTGSFALNEQQDFPFDISNGAIFSLKVMNVVNYDWSEAKGFRSVTMKLSNNTTSVSLTTNLTKFSEWEDVIFDFSSKPLLDYNTVEITFNAKNTNANQEDVFYVDEIKKLFGYRQVPISTPTNISVCTPEKIYATFTDANGCSSNSILTPNIKAGSFPINNPTLKVCQTGTTIGEATAVDFNSYVSQIIPAPTTGKSIIRWDITKTNYDSVYENFDNVNSYLTWNTITTPDQGNTEALNETYTNPQIDVVNGSATCGFIGTLGTSNYYQITTDLLGTIDLSKGSIFKLSATYLYTMNADGNAKNIQVELSGGGNPTRTSAWMPLTLLTKNASNQYPSNTWSSWTDLTFDFSAYATEKGFDRLTIRFEPKGWQNVQFVFDNLKRQMQPFISSTNSVNNMTVQNGDKVYAIVKDASGCLVKSTITFNVPDCGPPAIDQTDTMCEASLGSGNVTAINLTNYNNAIKGGVAANTVTWYSDATLTTVVATPTNVAVTNGLTFYALVKDLIKVKQDTATLKFTIKSLPNIVFPTINPVCEASSTYTITGTTPAGGAWSGGAYISAAGVFDPTKATVGAANSVTYSVTVNGCSSTKNTSVTVNTNPTPTLVTAAKDLLYCGTAGVPVSVSNNIGAIYNWTKNGSAIAGTTNSQTGLTTGTYAVTATLNGCSKSVTGIVVTGHVVPVYSVSGGGKYCDDTVKKQDITITLTQGDTPWNVYYKNGASKWSQTAITGTTYTIPTTNLSAGTYILDSLTNSYCKATVSAGLSATLTEVKRPTSSLQTTDLDYCGTASDVTLTVAAFTPASYQWKQGATVVGNNSNSYANASAGTYSVTLTNDICQTTISNIIVTAFAKPTYSFSGGGTFCAGKTINPVIVTLAGKAPWTVTYRIDGTDHPVSIPSSPYTVPQTIDGTYDIKSISDANTCTGDINTGTNGSATITINSLPTVTFAYVDSICQTTPTIDLSTKVSPKTGGTGLYSGTGVNATTGLFTHSGPNSYALMYTFTTTAGCVDSAKRTIKVNENPISSITPDPAAICIQKNIILDGNPTKGTTPYTHLWTDALGVSTGLKTNQTITVNTAIANTYSLDYTVTDKNGCKGTDNISVKVNGLPTITVTASPTAVCSGLNSTISATGASSYVWNTTVGTVNPSTTTTYIVTGTDGNGCINTASTILAVNALPTVIASASAPTICIGKATTISTSGANTYVWNPTSVGTINPTNTTTYYVTGTDTKGCTGTSSILVTVNQLPTIVAVASPSAICNGASSTLTVSGANTYAWDNTLGSGTAKTVSPTATKTYTVTGTDGNSCINSTTVQVTVNALPTITASPLASICSGVSATILASGATNYSWDNLLGIGSSKTVSPTATTTFSVTGTDGNNCSNTASTKITVNALPTVIASASSPTICIGKSTTVSATGANNYVWNPAGGLVSPTSSATYYVTGTDLKGCSTTSSASITVNQLPTVTWSTSNPHIICSDGKIVTLDVITGPTGGTGVFGSTAGLTKSSTTETSAIFDPKATGSGTKTLTLDYTYTDLNGCITAVKQDTIRIFDTPEPTDTSINTMSIPIPASYKFDVTSKSLTNVNWYNDPQGAVIGTGNVYIPVVTHTNTSPDSLIAGCHNYLFTQTINGCESQPAKAQECVINCPAQAPNSGIIPKPCTDVTLSTLLTATANGSGMLHWFDNANTKSANELGTGNSLTINETKAKTYTYYVAEYDALKACFGPTTPVTLTINPNPTVAILNNPGKVCQAEPSLTINATPIGGTFSGSGINATGTFNPSASVTLNSPLSITYSYTNPTTSCKHDTTFTITVNQKPVVTIGSKSSLINTPLVALVGVSDMTGGTFNWLDSTGANKGSGVNFIPSSIITNTTKISKHKLTYTHTSDEGCVSIPAQQTYTLFDCPAPQPTPTDNRKCIDNAAKQPTVSAKANGTGTLYWFTADNAKIGTEAGIGLSFNTAKTLAGTHTFYVAEYDAANTCFGPTAVANLIIDALPIVDINIADSVLCYDENAISLNVNQGIPSGPLPLGVITGSTAVAGTTFTPNKLITDTSATTTQTTNLIYTYTDIHGCKNSDSQQITVNFTKHPTTTDAQYLLAQIQSGTKPNLNVTGDAAATFNWYTDNALTGMPITGTPFNTGLTTITAMSGTDYWATQTVNGCQSLPTVANIKIVLCPTPVPTVKNESVCENVSIPNLTAVGTKLNWYNSANGSTTVTTEGATTFAHGNTKPGTYTYYVSQKLVDGITGNECEGPRNPIKITIFPKPTVTITNTITHLCIDYSSITLNTNSSVAGTGLFAESFLTNVTSKKADFDPKKAGVGSHTINYTFTDGNNCIDKTSQTIVVDSTAQVIIAQTFEDMVHNPKPQMTASGTGIKWYTSANLGTPIGTGSPFVDPTISETDVVTKDFWVTQTKNGCESQAIKTKLIIDACPVQLANIDKNNFKQCTYDNSPSLTASSGTGWPLPPSAKRGFYWYTSKTATSPVFVGNPYNPSVTGQTGVQTYYVAEYDSQYTCFGTRQKISFTIVPVAAPGVLSVNDICSGEANQTFKIDQALALNKYLWYGTADTLKGKLAIGTSFTPSDKTVGTHSYWAASTDENGCHSVVTPIAMTIKPRPGKPTLANDESCEGQAINTLTATGESNAIFEWYKGDSTHYSATIASYTPSITATTVFYVRQNLNSCRGWFAPDTYTVKAIPASPVVENKDICENNPIPTFTTTATGLINWYSQSQTFIGNSNPFTPSTKTTSDFYVSQTVKECESQKSKVTFTVHILPSKPIVTDNMHRCENFGNASVVVTSGTNIKWYAKNDTNATAISKGSMKYSYTNKKSGEYHIFVTQTDAFKCQSEAYDAVTYIDSVPVKPAINEPPIAICEYDGIPTLTCNNNNTIIWFTDGMDSLKTGNSFTPSHSQLKTGDTRNFVVRVISPNNCISLISNKVGITVKQTPQIPVFTTKNVCTEDSNQIVFKNKNGLYTIENTVDNSQWKTDSIFTVPSKYMETDGDKSFEIYQTINGCSSDLTTATYTVFKRPKPLISGKYELCENSYMIPYNVFNKNNGSNYKWSVTGNRVLYRADQSSQNFASNIDYNEMGIDTIKVMENNGYCIGTGTLVVRVAPAPTADFQWEIPGGMTQVYFQNTSIQNDIVDGKISEPVELSYFKWRFNRETDYLDSLQFLASFRNNENIKIRYNYGNHEATLVAINSYGCSDSITKKFFVDLAEGLYMPNSFVPTSPILGINKFLPKGFNLETYTISIYDVWGNLIWYSDKLTDGSPAEGWDGNCNGVVMKMDSYIWKVEATFKDGKEFGDKHGKHYSKFGNVLLIR